MEHLEILGGIPLTGSIPISGAKNSALPILCLPLLTDKKIVLHRTPLELLDVKLMKNLLSNFGVEIKIIAPNAIQMQLNTLKTSTAQPFHVNQMRASILVLGPLLSRHGKAIISLPGGCAIGKRPIDIHIKALQLMGAEIILNNGYIEATAKKGLHGANIDFDMVSVGATENILMAASLAKGITRMTNSACEPEVVALAEALVKMGAKIEGIGSRQMIVEGVSELKGVSITNIQDRLEASSMLIAFAATNGQGTIKYEHSEKHLKTVIEYMRKANVSIKVNDDSIDIDARNKDQNPVSIFTEPYPGFPTDLQAQWMAWMTTVKGNTIIKETIFENRFMHVPELQRLGADIEINNQTVYIKGVTKLKGAVIIATDIRASMGLIIAALKAEGVTIIKNLHHLDRGYERLEGKIANCGANIVRVDSNKSQEANLA